MSARARWFLVLLGLLIGACEQAPNGNPFERWADASTEKERFYALADAAKADFRDGSLATAATKATELLELSAKHRDNWNYGNAIHDGNLVLGRIALKNGQVDAAKHHLLTAGRTPGSPQLDSFGPNMSLAQDLLLAGERDVLIEYFELCRRFWDMHDGRLDRWRDQAQRGEMPDFGPNLYY